MKLLKLGLSVLFLLSFGLIAYAATPNWANLNFPSTPYLSNGPGVSAPWGFCQANPSAPQCTIRGPFDLGAVFVTQDFNFIAWKFVAPNMTGARFCNLTNFTQNVTISIEFDSDSNPNSGCSIQGGCFGFPGSEYRVMINSTGDGQLWGLNSSGAWVLNTTGTPAYTNITNPCSVSPTTFYLALNKSYKSTKKLFDNPECALTRGYYCRELVKALNKKKKNSTFSKVNEENKSLLKNEGVIVFIKRSKKYPLGHYLIKTKRGWMNPWINFPNISPAKSGFQKNLPGEAQWIIYKKE